MGDASVSAALLTCGVPQGPTLGPVLFCTRMLKLGHIINKQKKSRTIVLPMKHSLAAQDDFPFGYNKVYFTLLTSFEKANVAWSCFYQLRSTSKTRSFLSSPDLEIIVIDFIQA